MTGTATGATTAPVSRARTWASRIITALFALFMTFDGVIHVVKPAPVVDSFKELGIPFGTSLPVGVIELACLALYLVPRTSVLGAILLTGYLGGAIAIQLRAAQVPFNIAFPAILGVLMWLALWLRERRLQELLPVMR